MPSLLIVDDEKNMLISLEAIFREEGFRVVLANSAEIALQKMEESPFDLMITDMKMSEMSGLDLLQAVKKKKALPVIMITAYATPKSAVEAIKAGAFDYVSKPFDPDEIIFSVRRALEFCSIQKENRELKETLQGQKALNEIIGDDSLMAAIRQMIQTVAPTQATVLIHGESGTGKELVAKAIHELSLCHDKMFIPVNCAAIPEALLESELFGHEKGSFTGALYTKKGKFEIAEGGTLYLDEIADMPLALQAKILRVLEDGKFQRVGGTDFIQTRVRIIAATHQDLKKAIQEGSFREDLYFRLNVMTLAIPPLRERISDISKLIGHFIRHFNVLYGKDIQGVHPEALKVLTEYDWPGNVRELRNIIERSIILEKGNLIRNEFLPREILHSKDLTRGKMETDGKIDFKNAVENYEKQMILWALEKNQNRVSLAAQALGLSRHALRHYLLKYFKDRRDLNAE
ncbi:MAG: sigma-54-dependent Fis family transcriptional regulator [Chlamydiae bacterium]|nr:sigma-54-dependent Fis family transcriptional regulator [Chlamydiota bacterium]MBI3266100.1 sigma-54-dependent Fis family transcriptional regulator [Chlamydiota bacterium]